jgi:hypothetical protein
MTWELSLSHFAKRLIMIDHQLGDEDYHLARFIDLGSTSRVDDVSLSTAPGADALLSLPFAKCHDMAAV